MCIRLSLCPSGSFTHLELLKRTLVSRLEKSTTAKRLESVGKFPAATCSREPPPPYEDATSTSGDVTLSVGARIDGGGSSEARCRAAALTRTEKLERTRKTVRKESGAKNQGSIADSPPVVCGEIFAEKLRQIENEGEFEVDVDFVDYLCYVNGDEMSVASLE